MPVEYIDSPTGYIGLGETVGLGTITPQRRKRVRKGDRGIFPITPTGAESYEDPSFAPQRGFQQAYGAVPNVFERYAGLPGGARAGPIPGSGFEDVIFRPLPTDDVVEDDNDLEEELRRQTLDIDPYGDYYETQFDPSAPNYSPQAVAERAAAELSTFTSVPTHDEVVAFAARHGTTARQISGAMQSAGKPTGLMAELMGLFDNATLAGKYFDLLASGDPADREQVLDAVRGVAEAERQAESYRGRGEYERSRARPDDAETPTTPTSIRGELERSLQGYGTGAQSSVTKVNEVRDDSITRITLPPFPGTKPTPPAVTDQVLNLVGALDAAKPSAGPSVPQGVPAAPQDPISAAQDTTADMISSIDASQGFFAADQAGATLEDFSGLFNRGGKVSSFMGMKK